MGCVHIKYFSTTVTIVNKKPYATDKHNDNIEHATYTVVNKKQKNKISEKAEVHDNYESATQRNTNGQASLEDLYTVVKKKPKVRAASKEEEAPPIIPHTVEELYSAVNKTPKGNAADDEEEALPIRHHKIYSCILKHNFVVLCLML